MSELAEKLSYISKSKKICYETCPLQFKYNYVDKKEQTEIPAFTIGKDVHKFIEDFFKGAVDIDDKGELYGYGNLTFHPNTEMKKNFVKFEIDRWNGIKDYGKDKSFFFPIYNEFMYTTEKPKLIGVVDRIHKCCKVDKFAPKEEDFKDGDLVIVENKTGKPSKRKAEDYKLDTVWYKILTEIYRPELAPIKWAAIYFPFDNTVYHSRVTAEDCRKLAKEIVGMREKMIKSLEENNFPANPSFYNCSWCKFKHICDQKYV